jgi:hypothetical protein
VRFVVPTLLRSNIAHRSYTEGEAASVFQSTSCSGISVRILAMKAREQRLEAASFRPRKFAALRAVGQGIR